MKRHRPEDDPGWIHFPETILVFGEPPVLRIDAREPVDAAARERLAALGLDSTFTVITAQRPIVAPEGETGEDDDERDRRLHEALVARGGTVVRADGMSPDGTHVERGWAVPATRSEAAELARDRGQSAAFWFDGEALWIEPGLVVAAPVRLPLESRGLRGGQAGC